MMVYERYMKNVESVREIAKLFGYKLFSFEPNWSFVKCVTDIPSDSLEMVSFGLTGGSELKLTDDFIGRLAIFLGYEWVFEYSIDELEDHIKYNERSVNNIIDLKFDDEYKKFYLINIMKLKSEINIRNRLTYVSKRINTLLVDVGFKK